MTNKSKNINMQRVEFFVRTAFQLDFLLFKKIISWGSRAGPGAHAIGPRAPGVNFWNSRAHPMGPGAQEFKDIPLGPRGD